MRKKLGIFCILLGICCLLAAAAIVVYNHWEENRAANTSQHLLQDVREKMIITSHEIAREVPPSAETGVPAETEATPPAAEEAPIPTEPAEAEAAAALPPEMPTTQVDGYDCIGVLSIPVLELELPVLTDWSYAKLKIAPCHYYGTYYEPDFVIAAHNYHSHFGRLPQLQPKDLVLFTDISGTVRCYEVVLLETLPGSATEEMITSGFDLSLYTCTTGGSSRVTVRCMAMEK